MIFIYPYELEDMPPKEVIVDNQVVLLSRGWRLKRKPEYTKS